MKKFTILIIFALLANNLLAQQWGRNLPKDKLIHNELSFKEIQKEFYKAYPKTVIPDGKRVVNGVSQKIPGWKQFKRWEWYWENRVDKASQKFVELKSIDNYLQARKNKAAINGGGSSKLRSL